MKRHYGMDWLRVGAFALLILYHIGMVFGPWPYHVKANDVAGWVVVPMLSTNAWRLTLLFVVSGYASRALASRQDRLRDFIRNRSFRLLVPLIFGIVVIVPPQPWIELATAHGYTHGFGWFWLHDYFRFGALDGIFLPNWNHLWFVAYLWAYTMMLCVGIALFGGSGRVQRAYDWMMRGWGVVLIPLAWLLTVHELLFPMAGETHLFFDDGIAHAVYIPAFLFGFGLAGSPGTMAAIAKHWIAAGIAALLAYGCIAAIELHWLRPAPAWRDTVYLAAHAIQQACAIVALIGIADRFWNHDHAMRATLTEAVFPFYIIHQTIIVVAMGLLLPLALQEIGNFAIVLTATVIGCWAFYLIGRTIVPLRPLIGLRMKKPDFTGASLAVR